MRELSEEFIINYYICYFQMSSQGYKRTNFDEDDISNGGSPPAIDFSASVVFKGGLTLWQISCYVASEFIALSLLVGIC
jgi:hypothetical protein